METICDCVTVQAGTLRQAVTHLHVLTVHLAHLVFCEQDLRARASTSLMLGLTGTVHANISLLYKRYL
jgi:hypothetical protein